MDASDLERRLEALLRASGDVDAEVLKISPLGGGASQEIFRVEIVAGGVESTMVLRGDAKKSLQGSLNRKVEAQVIDAAVLAGVKTPKPKLVTQGLTREGAWSYLLDWVPGVAIGRRIVRDEALAAARKTLVVECAAELAKIHSVTPAQVEIDLPGKIDPVTSSIDAAYAAVDALPEPRPAVEIALRWLRENLPEDRRVTLVHGDFRTGNFMVSEKGLEAVLDWEFAHWGSAAEDLAWLCLRNWRFNQNAKAAGGFATRAALYDAYENARGEAVRPSDVHFWEVLGNVRWATGCAQQGERYLSGEVTDLELIAIPRRAPEMEFEALRLIERGPR